MTINQTTLRELCRLVASGDEQARHDFNRHVPPLLETVVHRWLRQHDDAKAPAANAKSRSRRVKQLTGELCARMIAEFEPQGRPAAPSSDETLVICGGADTLCWR